MTMGAFFYVVIEGGSAAIYFIYKFGNDRHM